MLNGNDKRRLDANIKKVTSLDTWTHERDSSLNYWEQKRIDNENLRKLMTPQELVDLGYYTRAHAKAETQRWVSQGDTHPQGTHPKGFMLSPLEKRVHELGKQGLSQRQMAALLGKSRSTIKKAYRGVKTKGYSKQIGYNLYEFLDEPIESTTSNGGGGKSKWFIHKFKGTFNFLDMPLTTTTSRKAFNKMAKKKCWVSKPKYWELSTNNPIWVVQGKDFSIRVRTKSMELWIKGIRGEDMLETLDELQDLCFEQARAVEDYLSINASKHLFYDARITSVHVANLNDKVWDALKSRGWQSFKHGGQIRMHLDKSGGEKHIEFTSTNDATDDAQKINGLLDDVLIRGMSLQELYRRMSALEKGQAGASK